jgi:hypothetical protein
MSGSSSKMVSPSRSNPAARSAPVQHLPDAQLHLPQGVEQGGATCFHGGEPIVGTDRKRRMVGFGVGKFFSKDWNRSDNQLSQPVATGEPPPGREHVDRVSPSSKTADELATLLREEDANSVSDILPFHRWSCCLFVHTLLGCPLAWAVGLAWQHDELMDCYRDQQLGGDVFAASEPGGDHPCMDPLAELRLPAVPQQKRVGSRSGVHETHGRRQVPADAQGPQ